MEFRNLNHYNKLGRKKTRANSRNNLTSPRKEIPSMATIIDGSLDAGACKAVYTASRLASGMYLYRLTAVPNSGGTAFTETNKFRFIK